MTRWRLRSLRGRATVFFGVASFSVTGLFAVSTYALAHQFLLQQRTQSVERRTALDARVLQARLHAGGPMDQVIESLTSMSASEVLVHRGGQWFSSSPDITATSLPATVVAAVQAGSPGVEVTTVAGRPAIVAGVRLPRGTDRDVELYEVAPLDELRRTMTVLATVLAAGTGAATVVSVGIAVWAGRRLVEPLNTVARAAAQIAGGQLSLRLQPTPDPDVITIVGSFNHMVDALQARIERDARFAADVSHELRTPLTTLVASIDVLQAEADQLPSRHRTAVTLAATELARFQRLLEELIELARYDAGLTGGCDSPVDVYRLLDQALLSSGRDRHLLTGEPGAVVHADKRRLTRAALNLLDNADRHGGGLVQVAVLADADSVRVQVDDAGPGVPAPDRERIFGRFATGGDARGSTRGTGLGLAIVAETTASLSGQVWCTDRPEGGARFVIHLPTSPDHDSGSSP